MGKRTLKSHIIVKNNSLCGTQRSGYPNMIKLNGVSSGCNEGSYKRILGQTGTVGALQVCKKCRYIEDLNK